LHKSNTNINLFKFCFGKKIIIEKYLLNVYLYILVNFKKINNNLSDKL